MRTLLTSTALVLKFIALVLKYIAVAIGAVMVGVPVLIIGLIYGIEAYQNATYARSAFGPSRGIERVVASKRWHGKIFGCTYAIAELTPARSAKLVADNRFREVFGEQAMYWLHPPNLPPTPANLNYLQDSCWLEGVRYADKQAILEGLKEPGGWAGAFGEYVAFFLPRQNLIGIIRNGD